MSGIKITSIDPRDDPQWLFENRRKFLSTHFEVATKNLQKLLNCNAYTEKFSVELNIVENTAQELYNSFTIDMVSSPHLDQTVNSLIVKLNERILGVQVKIEQYNIELRAESQIRETQIKRMIDYFDGDGILLGYKNDVSKIKTELATLKTDNLPLERLNHIKRIEESIETLLHQHDIAITINLDDTIEHRYTPKITKNNEKADGKAIFIDINRYYTLLRELDPESISQFTPLVKEASSLPDGQRIRLIRDNLALSYGKVKETLARSNVYKHLLEGMLSELNGKSESSRILKKLTGLKSEKIIDRAVFAQVQLEYLKTLQKHSESEERIKQRTSTIRELSAQLLKMGYSVTNNDMSADSIVYHILSGKVMYCDTKWEGYKILITMNKLGEIVTRIVKVSKNPDEEKSRFHISADQDTMIAKDWHASYDILMEHLRKTGFYVKTEKEKMPNEVNLEFVSSDIFEKRKRNGNMKEIDIAGLVKKNG